MHYEINVAKNGKHFFATSERSITSASALREVLPEIISAFPSTKGYTINVSRKETIGQTVVGLEAPSLTMTDEDFNKLVKAFED